MKIKHLLLALFSAGVIQTPLTTYAGALPDLPSFAQNLAALGANGQSVAGGVNFQASAAASLTLTNMGNLLQQFTNGGAVTVTLDSAYNMVKALPQPASVGQAFTFQIVTNAATTIATPTLSDTAVTLAGTTSVLAASSRWYQGVITQLYSTTGSTLTAGTTYTSIAQVGSTNNYTVTLATNAIVPVVGNLFYLGANTGTLPAGWYPINKVTSATSFVVALPPSGSAWTCVAPLLLSSATAPSTYSPLVTITGLWALVVSTASV
jgi:hypothetical protein